MVNESIVKRIEVLAQLSIKAGGPISVANGSELKAMILGAVEIITNIVNNIIHANGSTEQAFKYAERFMSHMAWRDHAWQVRIDIQFDIEDFYTFKLVNTLDRAICFHIHSVLSNYPITPITYQRFHTLHRNCLSLASTLPTPMVSGVIKAYLTGKADLAGNACDRTQDELLATVDIQLAMGINPDWYGQPEPLRSDIQTSLQMGDRKAFNPVDKDAANDNARDVNSIAVISSNGHQEFYFIRDDVHYIIARAYGTSPTGNPFFGAWVCNEHHTGKYIDHDKYRADLFERLNLKVK